MPSTRLARRRLKRRLKAQPLTDSEEAKTLRVEKS